MQALINTDHTHRYAFLLISLLLLSCSSNQHKVDQSNAGTLAIYGNWCGPDHPVDINNPPPAVDNLDAACMRHDYCYANNGYLKCDCDAELNREIKQALDSGQYSTEQIRYARATHAYFATSPCDGDAKHKTKPSRVLHDVYNKTKRGVMRIYDRITGNEEQNSEENNNTHSLSQPMEEKQTTE